MGSRREAFLIILLFGLVSLFADIVYEGARGVIPTYLMLLGAGSFIVGSITGAGEFVGYALRLIFGRAADVTGRYWLFTALGYILNLLTVPLLALAGRWEAAALLIILERLGKAIRTPARDTLLSSAVSSVGRGKGFGVHEALDQVGGLVGPLIAFLTLYLTNSYRAFFLLLLLPALVALLILYIIYKVYPEPLEPPSGKGTAKGKISAQYWRYLIAASLSVAGFMSAPLLLYRAGESGLLPEYLIPALYLLAMGVDGAMAIPSGLLYDKHGLRTLALCFLLTPLIPLAAFNAGLFGLILAAIVLGVVVSMHETMMRAAVADLSDISVRGTAYGIFNTAYGLSWLVAGAVIGYIYQFGWMAILALSLTLQIPAILIIIAAFE